MLAGLVREMYEDCAGKKYKAYVKISGQDSPAFEWRLYDSTTDGCVISGGSSLMYVALDDAVTGMLGALRKETGGLGRVIFEVGDPPALRQQMTDGQKEAWEGLEKRGLGKYSESYKKTLLSMIEELKIR